MDLARRQLEELLRSTPDGAAALARNRSFLPRTLGWALRQKAKGGARILRTYLKLANKAQRLARAEVARLRRAAQVLNMEDKHKPLILAAARGGKSRDEIDRLTRRFDLDLDKRVRAYSRGMKQKLGLIQALMHRPQLLILDEPTVSLDPLIREVLYEELHNVTADG